MTIEKYYGDQLLRNVFFKINSGTNSVEDRLRDAIVLAEDKVCLVMQDGLTDVISEYITDNHSARKYILVSSLNEKKYIKLKGQLCIVREVAHIRGNYVIVDDKTLILFDEKLNGLEIKNESGIESLMGLFQKEFWENATYEMIDERKPAAEATFDLPPIYSNNDFKIDESFDDSTKVEGLINTAKGYGLPNKIEDRMQFKELKLKDIKPNADFLKTTNNEKIRYAPNLSGSMVFGNEGTFALNFDIAQYNSLPEKKEGRLFAIKCEPDLSFGDEYQFQKSITYDNAIDKDILDLEEKTVVVKKNTTVDKSITVDLKVKYDLEHLLPDARDLRLEKISNNTIFQTNELSSIVAFNIDIIVKKRNLQKKAEVYNTFNNINDELKRKVAEISGIAVKNKKAENLAKTISVSVGNIAQYKSTLQTINECIFVLNQGEPKNNIDESLSEIKETKKIKDKKITIKELIERQMQMDMPKYGILYQNNDIFQYVLDNESDLQNAVQEMQNKKIEFVLE